MNGYQPTPGDLTAALECIARSVRSGNLEWALPASRARFHLDLKHGTITCIDPGAITESALNVMRAIVAGIGYQLITPIPGEAGTA